MATVIITPRSLSTPDHPALAPLRDAGHDIVIPCPGATPTSGALRDCLPDAAGWLAGVEPVTAELMAAAPGLRVIARNGVGTDNVDLAAARARGIEVAVAPGANSRGVAELALGLILSLARNIPATSASVKSGGWDRTQGLEVEGRTLGLAGCGNIGKMLARMAIGVGMNVIAYDLYPDAAFTPDGFRYVDVPTLLAESDVLSLHLPSGDAPFLDGEKMGGLKKGCLVVNTARAGVVDQAAMTAALDDGRVGGYAVDAFDPEPPGVTPLTAHPRTVCTAHIGGFTKESVMRAARQAAENIVAVLAQR